jgi:hypothetical protein
MQSGSKAMKQTKQAAELLNMAEESKKGTAAKAVNRVSAQRSRKQTGHERTMAGGTKLKTSSVMCAAYQPQEWWIKQWSK